MYSTNKVFMDTTQVEAKKKMQLTNTSRKMTEKAEQVIVVTQIAR